MRNLLSLDGSWNFCVDSAESFDVANAVAQTALQVSVPAPVQQHPALREFTGVGWYWRTVRIDSDALRERAAVLCFGAVDYFADVYVNGAHVGRHEGGYLPFEFDITRQLKSGENSIAVRVDDAARHFPEIPHGKQSWYGPISGIWQPVTLDLRPHTHITALKLAPHGAQIDVSVALNQPAPGAMLHVHIFAPDGTPAGEYSGPADALCVCPVATPQLWDIDSPNLYTVRATVSEDSVSDTCGFRTIEARAGKLWLNGRPVYLRSALDQDYYPDNTYTAPSLEYIEAQFRQAKAMGLNSLRIHIKIGDPRYYIAADRVGLLIWTELPNWQLLTDASDTRGRETFLAMHARDFNRPSIVIRSIINEAWGIDVHNIDHQRWLSAMYDWLKQLDPTRLVVDNSACNSNYHVVSDIDDMHVYYAIPDHYAQFREWTAALAARPKWTYAPKFEGNDDRVRFLKDHWHADWITPSPENRRRGDEPLMVSEFGNWGLPDVGKLREYYGGDPWWFNTGMQHGSGEVYPHDIDQRFALYHLNRVFPTLSALSHASQTMQLAAFKFELEEMRRHSSIQGYVITEFTDLHWECNGMLDMARNPKVMSEPIAQVNADDVLLPECARTAYWEGETVDVKLAVSQYSTRDLSDCAVEWSLKGTPIAGKISAISPKMFDVIDAGVIRFTAPATDSSQKLRLELNLVKQGQVVAQNWLDLYVFPRASAAPAISARIYAPDHSAALRELGYTIVDTIAESDVVVAATLTEALREYLLAGGHVLWLAESDDAQQSRWGGYHPVNIGPRQGTPWSGDWASNLNWLCQDVYFKDIPTDGLVDFAFADLTPEHVIHGVHPMHFANDVHSGLFLGWIHKAVALIARRSVGRGQLMISTYRLRAQLSTHPVAAILLRDLLKATMAG